MAPRAVWRAAFRGDWLVRGRSIFDASKFQGTARLEDWARNGFADPPVCLAQGPKCSDEDRSFFRKLGEIAVYGSWIADGVEEYGNWRQVRDCDGILGRMHRSHLSARRTAIVGRWKVKSAALHAGASQSSGIAAHLAPRVRLQINSCKDNWCSISVPKHKLSGFIDRSNLWGVYPSERISN